MIINTIEEGRTNVVDNKTIREIFSNVLQDVYNAVGFTLGPAGKTALLHDPNGVTSLYPNKDGFVQITNLHYNDYFYDSVLKIIRDAAMHCNITIGDATTSSVIILKEFYEKLRQVIDESSFEYISDSGVVTILEVLKNTIKKYLYDKNFIKKLQDETITHDERLTILTKVATIAANNDNEIGSFVAKIFNKVIDSGDEVDVSIVPNSYSETTESTEIGFYLPCGHIHRVYSTERDGRSAIYHNPRFLIVEGPILDGDIKTIEPFISHVCVRNNQPLVIIAQDYSRTVMQWLYALRIGGKGIDPSTNKQIIMEPLNILPIQHSSADDLGHERTIDLEIALGGRALPLQSSTLDRGTIPDQPLQMDLLLGRAKKITSSGNESRIFEGEGNPEKIKGRIKELEENRDSMVINDSDIAQLTIADYSERIAMLKSNMISIKVGGTSYKERQYNVRVYEDAVYACKATIKHGYTLIGQTSLRALIGLHRNELVKDIVNEILAHKNNVIFGSPNKKQERLTEIVEVILNVLFDSALIAYKNAIQNAIRDEKKYNEIIEEIDKLASENKIPFSYNILDDSFYALTPDCPIYSAGSTDWEILHAIISVIAVFFNVNTLMTLYIPIQKENEK